MKNKIEETKDEARTILSNFKDLIEALAIGTCALTSLWVARTHLAHLHWKWTFLNPVLISGAIVAVIAFYQFVKYLNKKG